MDYFFVNVFKKLPSVSYKTVSRFLQAESVLPRGRPDRPPNYPNKTNANSK